MLRFAEYLELQDFRQTTAANYYRALRLISEHFGRDPLDLTEEDLRSYFVFVRTKRNWAPKSCRQHLAGAKHFYRGMLGRGFESLDQIKARDRETLPDVLTPDEVARVLGAVPFLRYRVPLILIYACGLRVRECVGLTIDDIDGPGNRLLIRDGKGGKDRYTILGNPVYDELRRYWSFHKNPKLLFPAVGRGLRNSKGAAKHMGIATEPMDTNSLRTHLRKAAQRVGVRKKVTTHILRHSFATHLAAKGVPIHQIQSYLGHAHIETTTVYTHLSPINHVEAIGYVDDLLAPILKR
jgi:site-specific recombinase XerD